MKTHRSSLFPCMVVCVAGLSSCSGDSDTPQNQGLDGSYDGGRGGEVAAPTLDGARVEALGIEAARPLDAAVDRADTGPDVWERDPRPVPDAPLVYRDAPPVRLDGKPPVIVDVRLDNEAGVTEAGAMGAVDATDLEVASSEDDANQDGPTSDEDAVADCGRIKCDCTYKGIRLWGDVEYVNFGADFKVKKSAFPDLNVGDTRYPSRCGQWHTVNMFGDFKVQLVSFGEDFSISQTDSPFPGIPGR